MPFGTRAFSSVTTWQPRRSIISSRSVVEIGQDEPWIWENYRALVGVGLPLFYFFIIFVCRMVISWHFWIEWGRWRRLQSGVFARCNRDRFRVPGDMLLMTSSMERLEEERRMEVVCRWWRRAREAVSLAYKSTTLIGYRGKVFKPILNSI